MINKIEEININDIEEKSLKIDDKILKFLTFDIKQLQPIYVKKNNNDRYEIISGVLRYRIFILKGLKQIPCIVLNDELNPNQYLLIENINRQNLSVIDEAIAISNLLKQSKLTQVEVANTLGYKQSTIANKLRLLKLPEYIKQALSLNLITQRHARCLLKVKEEDLEKVFITVLERNYNVSKCEEYVNKMYNEKKQAIGANTKLALNTILESYNLCKQSGCDIDLTTRNSNNITTITIKIRG